MKRSDIALIGVVAFISLIVSFVLSNVLFPPAATGQTQVESVPIITSTFQRPDGRYFSKNSFDPTKQITTGIDSNNTPFSGAGQ